MSDTPSVFRETAGQLARQLREAAVDHHAFERGLAVCELVKCRAMCCHDGVILSDEEAEVLSIHGGADGLAQTVDGTRRTITTGATKDEMAEDFPDDFPKTRCVFLDSEHRCHWQLKAMDEKRHPWFYKPTSCWMHPLLLVQREGRPVLTILASSEDRKGFASKTPCGQQDKDAPPARVSLNAELEMLSLISGRDFVGEINAPEIEY